MKVCIRQPYFSPYPGFFYLSGKSDLLVLLDQVQFPRGTTWLSRNRFKNDQGLFWLTVPVWRKGLGLQTIDQVRICYNRNWPQKHILSLKAAYGNAPYLDDHLPFLENLLGHTPPTLFQLNLDILHYLHAELGIQSSIVLQSALESKGRGQDLLLNICRKLEASALVLPPGAGHYLDLDMLKNAGLTVIEEQQPDLVYPQLWGDFIPRLSSWDLLFNCGPRAREVLFHRSSPARHT